MASFKVDGLFDLSDIVNAGAIPNEVMNRMLHAAAGVAVKAQKKSAREMLNGKYATGQLAESIKEGRIKSTRDGKSISIEFTGSRKRGNTTTSNAEIAFINEFGSPRRGIKAREFIKKANRQCENEALDAAGKVLDEWMESQGF